MSLARGLGSLRRSDDGIDLVRRRSELDQLVRCLTLSEVRRLRLQLNDITIPCDLCVDLPIELVLCISRHLGLDDILRIRSVSRHWNKTFSSPIICNGLIKKNFYPFWERQFKHLDIEKTLTAKEEPVTWLQRAAFHSLRRHHGLFSSMLIYNPEDCTTHEQSNRVDLDPQPAPTQQYCNGRLGFKLQGGMIKVKDFRSDTELIFAEKNREPLGEWLLSDRLVVAVKTRPATLMAWSLDSNQQKSHSVRLPGSLLRLTACQNRVGIVTVAMDILIWNVGGLLKSLDNHDARDSLKDLKNPRLLQAAVFFHPDDLNQIFVVYQVKADPREGAYSSRFMVQHYKSLNLAATYPLDLGTREPNQTRATIHVSNDGNIGIASRGFMFKDFGVPWTPYVSPLIIFDIYALKFKIIDFDYSTSLFYHQSRYLNHELSRNLYWRNQIIIPSHNRAFTPLERINSREVTMKDKVEYPYTLGYDLWLETDPQDIGDLAIVGFEDALAAGDDDFVIVFGKQGYVVWCFDKDVKLPDTGAMVFDRPPSAYERAKLAYEQYIS